MIVGGGARRGVSAGGQAHLDFATFFEQVMPGIGEPYPYQERLATEPWPALVDVPTGLGKTAAVTLAWLFKRLHRDKETPPRLLWCLPMRVLVEQTRDHVVAWLDRARPLFEARGFAAPTCHVLMGGDIDDGWIERPEDSAIIIGTQDMLLSRALMRGYAMNRYRWPIDFALVHHDALWVFDEVQLMGAGLATSAQLEAFRRDPAMASPRGAQSLWLSATLRPEWLGTVDFRQHLDELSVFRLSDHEQHIDAVRRRREARKTVKPAGVRLTGTSKSDVAAYTTALAELVCREHTGDAPTLVILNSVERAQRVMEQLHKLLAERGDSTELLLVHARFRAADREQINTRIRAMSRSDDIIVVATQAIEAGVDVTSKRLFAELAPWSSLVQRFGRCNRGGEYNETVDGGTICWLDLDVERSNDLALPYEVQQLADAREKLVDLTSAAPADLPTADDELPFSHVLRRKDFIELFNTDPDLSGHDVDISLYLRDGGPPQAHVFWREFEGAPGEEERPARDELCPVSIGQLQEHLGQDDEKAYVWDGLAERWRPVHSLQIRPGHVIMLRAVDGGYDADLGFVPRLSAQRSPIAVLGPRPTSRDRLQDGYQNGMPEGYGDDRQTQAGSFVTLAEHSIAVRDEAARLCDSLGEITGKEAVMTAALWHDVGKAHAAAQTAYLDFVNDAGADREAGQLWAKTPGRGQLRYRIEHAGTAQLRRHFRHELASTLAWLEHGPRDEAHDVIAYLIAAHHGKLRLGIRALPGENTPRDSRRFARGIWDGDTLPRIELNGVVVPETSLRLDVMELGEGAMGSSWTARTRRLLRELGPFRLAWLEMLVRIADWRASAAVEHAARGGDLGVEVVPPLAYDVEQGVSS